MQRSENSNYKNGGNPQVQSVIIIAITLFALAGAILGFSIGALTRHSTATSQTNNSSNNSTTKKSTRPAIAKTVPPNQTPAVAAVPLGCPSPNIGTPLSSTFTYQFTLQVMDKTGTTGTSCNLSLEKPITSDGVTCRIWLTKAEQNQPEVTADDIAKFQHIADVTSPLPHEIVNGLAFDSTTPQTQSCKNGVGTWNISLSPSLPTGHYYIVGLTSNGTFFNWSWSARLTVK